MEYQALEHLQVLGECGIADGILGSWYGQTTDQITACFSAQKEL